MKWSGIAKFPIKGVKDASWENLGQEDGQAEKWHGLPSHQAPRYQREQSKGGITSPPLPVLRGMWKQDLPVRGMWGRPQGPGIPAKLPVNVKAELARNELWTWQRAKKERAPGCQTFLKQGHHKHFHPSLMHKLSADPCTVSVVLTCFPNFCGVDLHNLELEKCREAKWPGEQSPKYFLKNAIAL